MTAVRRPRRVAASLLAAAVLGSSTLVATLVAPSTPAGAAGEAAISVSKTVDIARAGENLTVTGSGFDATGNLGTRPPLSGQPAGVYVIFGKFDANWKPSAGAASSTRRVIDQVWALPEPSYSAMNPGGTNPDIVLMAADGSFTATVEAKVDARAGIYGVYTYPGSGATNAANEVQQATRFTPAMTVSKTAGIARAGEALTVTADGFNPTGNLGTRPPLSGQPAGAYVVFGKFDANWKPSAGAASSTRRVIDQVWALPEPSFSAMNPGGTNPDIVLMNPDGSFTATVDAKIDLRAGRYGVFTYPGSGATNAANELEQLVTFAPGIAVSKTTDIARAGEVLTVQGDGFSATGNLGTRPPLSGQPAGAYVVFGKFDEVWQPSTGAASATRRVIDQVWALPEPSFSAMNPGGTNPDIVLLNADGTFTATVDAALDPRDGRYGVFTYPGSGAVNAGNEFEQLVSFKIDPPAAPAITGVTVAEGQATVTWTAPTNDNGAPVTSYLVTPKVGDTVGMPVEVAAPATSTTITGLPNGSEVTFTVAAQNSAGTGAASAASAAVTPQWWLPWSSGDVAITELFTWLTGKAPTASELAVWKADLDAGVETPGSLVAALRAGTDATANVDPTTRLYSAYLTRVPDASGLNFWLNRRRNGYTLIRISSFFADSNEFKNRYGSLSNQAFVELIYENVLRRSPDASGLAFWTNRLNTKKISRGQLMINLSESNEFKNKEANRVTAAVLYIHLLGTTPTVEQRDALVARLADGDTVAEIVRDLIHEASFDTRAG